MKNDFNKINDLSLELAFRQPQVLFDAVMLACSDGHLPEPAGQDYGTSLGREVTQKLVTISQYARTRNFREYLDFETALQKVALNEEEKQTSNGDFKAIVAYQIIEGVRHAICRSSPELRAHMTRRGEEFEGHMQEAEQGHAWSPEGDLAEASVEQAIGEGRITAENSGFPLDYDSIAVKSDDFLQEARRLGIFADGPKGGDLSWHQLPAMRARMEP